MYYNTVNLESNELIENGRKAVSQEQVVYQIFLNNPHAYLTPFEVMKLANLQCINSVRRAITDLTTEGKLQKTSVKKVGEFGHKNHTWKLD